jgi:hypothetical protein
MYRKSVGSTMALCLVQRRWRASGRSHDGEAQCVPSFGLFTVLVTFFNPDEGATGPSHFGDRGYRSRRCRMTVNPSMTQFRYKNGLTVTRNYCFVNTGHAVKRNAIQGYCP